MDTQWLLRFHRCHYLVKQWTNTLRIDSTHRDENDEIDAVGLYSREKCCQCTTIPRTILCDVNNNTLRHNLTLHIQ